MYRRHNSAIDGEGLQADVMRFMAIIAFCLVAIMALVRDAVPSQANVPEVLVIEPEPKLKPVPRPASKPAELRAQATKPKPKVRPKLVAKTPAPAPVPKEVVIASPPAETQAPTDEPGLSLRFGSDQDFLRLIARGDVAVYLFSAQSAYRLGKNYAFAKAPAPGQLYELMPSTIPSAIKRAARASMADSDTLRWGVAMPPRIAARIKALVQVERSGQLVINRFGEVRHQPNRSLAGG